MSKVVNRNKYWACPFFKWDGAREISCDGGRIFFPSSQAANAYMDTYCAANPGWSKCTVAATLYEFYDEEEDNHAKHRQNQRAGKSAGRAQKAKGKGRKRP